ncbi:MAG TPA: BPL-N domain-containing protein [Opitutales bacterium]|nr:BPL-N domain-containing protein [Opitutales bacterium]
MNIATKLRRRGAVFSLATVLLTSLYLSVSAAVPGLDVFVNEGAGEGPTIFAVIGLDGNRDDYAPALAAEFQEWPVQKGKFIFAVVNDAARKTGDEEVRPTSAFPVKGEREKPVGKTAEALWEIAAEADYILDFREASNSRQTHERAYGQTIIVVRSTEAVETANHMAHAMNFAISDPDLHWTPLRGGLINMLARASHAHFETEAMTVYFSRNLLDANQKEHLAKLGIYRLLDKHRMIDIADERFQSLDPKPRVPNYREMYPGKRLVGVFMGNGAGQGGIRNSMATFDEIDNVVTVRFTSEEVRDGILDQFDAVIFPGGSGSGQARALGADGRAKVTEFVQNGGGYIGICAGAYLAMSGMSWGLDLINAETVSPQWRRGSDVLPIELSDAGSELYGGERTVNVRYNQGPIIQPSDHPDLPAYEVLAYFRGEVAKNDTPVGIQIDSPAIAASTCGDGQVVIISPHPESTVGAELGYFLTKSAEHIFPSK